MGVIKDSLDDTRQIAESAANNDAFDACYRWQMRQVVRNLSAIIFLMNLPHRISNRIHNQHKR